MSQLVALLAALFVLAAPSDAITPTPEQLQKLQQLTPEQLQKLQQLTPEQQRALAARVAGGGTGGKTQADRAKPQSGRTPAPAPAGRQPSNIERQFNGRLLPRVVDAYSPYSQLGPQTGDRQPSGLEQDEALRRVLDRQSDRRRRTIHQHLTQFGYNQLAGKPDSFAPETNIPIPPQYLLGPGDELQLHYFGRRNDTISLVIDRDGMVYLPDVGPIALANLSFHDAKALLAQTVRHKLTGVTATITMGQLRSIRIFVLGEANHPGSYMVNGLATISNALFIAGGVSKRGSLRHILLRRGGKVIRDLDLYQLLLHGDGSGDQRLRAGDVVFVPPIGRVVAVAGMVVRPAIYELRSRATPVRALLDLAGGIIPGGDADHMQLDRLTGDGGRTLIDLDRRAAGATILRDGDLLKVYPVPGRFEGVITLSGRVKRPGTYGLTKRATLRDFIHARDDLLEDASLDYLLIQRTDPATQRLSILRVPLRRLLGPEGDAVDLPLQNHDRIYVLSERELHPLDRVEVAGEVRKPGSYPLSKGMRVLDLLLAAGGTTEKAFLKEAEITRYRIVDGKERKASHIRVNLRAVLAGDDTANIRLQPDDQLMVRRLGSWHKAARFTIRGEVLFPGSYPIEKGEHLSDLIARAGGLTDKAYLRAALFTRESIRKEQKKRFAGMIRRIREEIAKQEAALSGVTDAKRLAAMRAGLDAARETLRQMEQIEPTGRLVLEFTDLAHLKGSAADITLRDGDSLYIPQQPNEVMVMGQVYNSTALIYAPDRTVEDYIARAGGLSRMADEDAIYVVHANGMVEASASSGWGRSRVAVGPGDVIVVPQKLERFDLLSAALDWSKVLYQVGVALASMKTIGIL